MADRDTKRKRASTRESSPKLQGVNKIFRWTEHGVTVVHTFQHPRGHFTEMALLRLPLNRFTNRWHPKILHSVTQNYIEPKMTLGIPKWVNLGKMPKLEKNHIFTSKPAIVMEMMIFFFLKILEASTHIGLQLQPRNDTHATSLPYERAVHTH